MRQRLINRSIFRRGGISPAALATAGLLLIGQATTCAPTSLLDSTGATDATATTSDAAAIDASAFQNVRSLTPEEFESLLAQDNDPPITLVFVPPSPSPGPEGPRGPAGPPGPPGPGGALVGEIRMWAGPASATPAGWLPCDGSAVDRVLFAPLFGVLGTRYGAGDGVSTFQLPDFRNRCPVGAGGVDASGHLVTDVEGTPRHMGGTATNVLSVAQLPQHRHTLPHTHTLTGVSSGTIGTSMVQLVDPLGGTQVIQTNQPSSDQTDAVGSGQPVNNVQPYFAVTYIIYAGP